MSRSMTLLYDARIVKKKAEIEVLKLEIEDIEGKRDSLLQYEAEQRAIAAEPDCQR